MTELRPKRRANRKDYEGCGGNRGAETPVDLHCAGGTYAGKDPASAFKYTLQAAEQGYAPAQAAAGIMYATDKGVQQNYAEAAKWWIAAAVGGYLLAASNLSMLYRSGVRLKPDANAANKWAKFVADCGAGAAH